MRWARLSWLAVPVLDTLFQIFMKRGAEQLDGAENWFLWLTRAYQSPWIIAALFVEIACFLIWMNVLSEMEISKASPLSGISYLFIVAAGWFLFGEHVDCLQLLGGVLILGGVWFIATAHRSDQKFEPALPVINKVREP